MPLWRYNQRMGLVHCQCCASVFSLPMTSALFSRSWTLVLSFNSVGLASSAVQHCRVGRCLCAMVRLLIPIENNPTRCSTQFGLDAAAIEQTQVRSGCVNSRPHRACVASMSSRRDGRYSNLCYKHYATEV